MATYHPAFLRTPALPTLSSFSFWDRRSASPSTHVSGSQDTFVAILSTHPNIMRLIPYLAVGASLASAAPLSIIVSTTEVGSFRLGKPVHEVKTNGALILPPTGMRKACNKMQGGMAKLFALAGLGPVMAHDMKLGPEHHVAHLPGEKQFWDPAMPPHHLEWHHNGEHRAEELKAVTVDENGEPPRAHHRHMHHGGHFRHMHHRGSFIRRIHRALMSLGPWEGRAIAFVLGCGIGVLLRMIWVMFVVFKRVFSGSETDERSEDEAEYERVAVLLPMEMESEELFAAPPEYYADEKTPVVEEKKDDKN
ncbi:unnamed protein product [Peniophora sp. CBMAI 1063]|nr:unnamed protein product [Peniophora sp. CBMAI 1063]